MCWLCLIALKHGYAILGEVPILGTYGMSWVPTGTSGYVSKKIIFENKKLGMARVQLTNEKAQILMSTRLAFGVSNTKTNTPLVSKFFMSDKHI